MKKIVITGMGVRCGTAHNSEEFAKACLSGQTMIDKCTVIPTDGLYAKYFGAVPDLEGERGQALITSATEEMLSSAGMTRLEMAKLGHGCRVFAGTLAFSADLCCHHSQAKLAGTEAEEVDFYATASCLQKTLGVKTIPQFISSACSSSTTAVGMALDYIRNELCDYAVAGGFDPLSILTACGFNALKSLSPGICNPFDADRDGLNIGEGAAFFFLETEASAKARGAKILCEVAGYGISNDAYHITSPDPQYRGVKLALQAALDDAGLKAEDIDYINAHGTGTKVNDSMEYAAMTELFSGCNKDIWFSSIKGVTGHCMGAAGAVELAASIISMNQGLYLPMARLKNLLATEPCAKLKWATEARTIPIDVVMSNSFAFSGHNSSIIIKRYSAKN